MARPHSQPAWTTGNPPIDPTFGHPVVKSKPDKCKWDERFPPATRKALDVYLGHHSKKDPVSIRRVIKAMRMAIPNLSVSDEELARMIAEEAIDKGCLVDFESKELGPEFHILR